MTPVARRRTLDLTPADLLAVRAALGAGGSPSQALAEVSCAALHGVREALAAGVPLSRIAADADLPAPATASLVRVLATAELVGAPAGDAVQAVLSAVDQQARLQSLVDIRSAQALLSARFLTALPIAGALLVVVTDADARRVMTGPLGLVLVLTAGVLIGAAVLWMRRLLRGVAGAGSTADPLLTTRRNRLSHRSSQTAAAGPRPDHPGQLPTAEAIDLIALGLAAGVGIAEAVRTAATVGPPSIRAVLLRTARHLTVGVEAPAAFPDGLAEVARLIDISHRWGAPTAEALRVLATDLRGRAAAAAEAAAERLTVHLIFPTTLLLVPAFALLVVTPTVVAMLGSSAGLP